MTNYRLSLTDKKPYSYYSKKITKYSLILSAVLILLSILIYGFKIKAFVLIFLISCAIVIRLYSGKMYFNEPFFQIQDDIIKYRFNENFKTTDINTNEISLIEINGSTIVISDFKGKLVKIKLGFIPQKFEREIKKQVILFAKEKAIKIK